MNRPAKPEKHPTQPATTSWCVLGYRVALVRAREQNLVPAKGGATRRGHTARSARSAETQSFTIPNVTAQIPGLDLHAEYAPDRSGGDFFDFVHIGSRVCFLLADIAGSRAETEPIAAAAQAAFRPAAANLVCPADANLMESTELLVQAVNHALMGAARGIHFAPTFVGCYDLSLGVLAYVNAGGQTAMLRDSEGTRPLPNIGMPLGLFTHLTFDASMQVLEPGAQLLLVTKGVIDTLQGKIPFGPERVQEVLANCPRSDAAELTQTTLAAAHGFEKHSRNWLHFGRAPLHKDRTALALIRKDQKPG
jgi:serine phosphatase RsbU (regulator of sigma subunit)